MYKILKQMKMKYNLLTLILFTVCHISFAQDDWNTLKKDNYEISYPNSWESSEQKPQPTIQFLLLSDISSQQKDSFRENINMSIENLGSQNPSLIEYTKVSLDQVKAQVPTAKIISNNSTNVNGTDMSDILWTATFGTIELKFRQFLCIKKSTAYIITFTATASDNR